MTSKEYEAGGDEIEISQDGLVRVAGVPLFRIDGRRFIIRDKSPMRRKARGCDEVVFDIIAVLKAAKLKGLI